MTPKIVVTGFEPWAHGTENPTLEVLDRLEHANEIAGALTTVRLPVDSLRLAGIVEETLDRVQPNLWISLGLAPGASVIAVERLAGNVLDFPIPDNVGNQPGGEPVFPGGPAAYFATIPVKAIAFGLRAAGIPAKISNTASTYGCNQMMYTVLHLIARKGLPTRAGFLHVPASPSLAAQQVYPQVEMPSMCVELTTRAVQKAIALALETKDDLREPAFNY
jgi:pyroglutamyl-peptidase